MNDKKANMYSDRVRKAWNPCVGCRYECEYCKKSFQAQMRRLLHNCQLCADYVPHFHPERLSDSLPRTSGDQFIWPCSSGDISCMKEEWINKILEVVKKRSDKTFFFQSKDPSCFNSYSFPDNVILAITLETNRDEGYSLISKAPVPSQRMETFLWIDHPRKRLTIEPILVFDLTQMVSYIQQLRPEITYVGYDSKKCHLPEPKLKEANRLINELSKYTRVKKKLLRERYDWADKYLKKFAESTLNIGSLK